MSDRSGDDDNEGVRVHVACILRFYDGHDDGNGDSRSGHAMVRTVTFVFEWATMVAILGVLSYDYGDDVDGDL